MTTVIIGANRGIGLELATQLSDRGDDVVGTFRAHIGGLESMAVDTIGGVDMTTDTGVSAMIEGLKDRSIGAVYVVAGVLKSTSLDNLNLDTVKELFDVNAVAPLRAIAALREAGLLKPGSKIGLLTSRMGSVADNDSGSSYAYRMSKAALNMAGKSLAIDLKTEGVSVALLHPGWVRTDMTSHTGLIDADESARGLIAVMDQLTLENTGGFWHQNGNVLPW